MKGQCTCGACQFVVTAQPIVVHACHCTWCQRETGAAFATNAVIETSAVTLLSGTVAAHKIASASGRGQVMQRCADCGITLWSHYPGSGDKIAFVRVGTLDAGHGIAPTIHIYTESSLPWVVIPEGVPSTTQFYNPDEVWGPDGLARYTAARHG